MNAINPQDLPDRVLGAIISGFGISYFFVFLLQFLLFHFPSSQEAIPEALAVIAFGTAAIPTIIFLFPAQPWLQLGYTSALAVIAIGSLPQKLLCDVNNQKSLDTSSIHLASVIMLSLTPTIHALAEPVTGASPLAIAFGRMVIIGSLSFAFYFLQPLERIGLARIWQLSFHGMHMMLTFSLVAYSKAVMQAAVARM
ncbi:uncharacterized protein N7484_005338 [Penicillium longicatenatum]|uniref:uncharacterized protein n=1 Tax=Penicillium longicatenatum TaxID=1561947 RepID=UPI0025467F08|nr:uncharacterized protein N7484_005338 [Penicillium longicatenatum]KAJ5651615.1 hypothetical protein N7484_005338 [Penicillium longicatenatum]